MDVSFDEVPKSNSSSTNFWIASVTFKPCGVPYPFRIVEKSLKKDRSTVKSLYKPVVKEVKRACLHIRHILADAKERKRLMGLAGVTARFACEVCLVECKRVRVGGRLYISFPW